MRTRFPEYNQVFPDILSWAHRTENYMLTTIITAAITSIITGLITFALQERKLKMELRTEFMAEQVARTLLENKKWKKRSFAEIKKRLGGFEDDELRKILVRSGAVKFVDSEGKELWGLLSRNYDDLYAPNKTLHLTAVPLALHSGR